MSEPPSTKTDRPLLPRDTFRAQRTAGEAPTLPVVVTPDYEDKISSLAITSSKPNEQDATPLVRFVAKPSHLSTPKTRAQNESFDAYGERSSSRPYALRLPGAIDLALRQIAAEERTHPLRIIDRILYDYLKRTGRLPPLNDGNQ